MATLPTRKLHIRNKQGRANIFLKKVYFDSDVWITCLEVVIFVCSDKHFRFLFLVHLKILAETFTLTCIFLLLSSPIIFYVHLSW